jgi:DNA-binding MarR family transcriptional regulator
MLRTMPKPSSNELAVWRQLQWATALIMGRFRRDLADVGLPIEEFAVLVHLGWAPHGTLPLQELAASMVLGDALSRSGLTRMLDRMENDGLIRRTVSRHDRRRFDVSLTRLSERPTGVSLSGSTDSVLPTRPDFAVALSLGRERHAAGGLTRGGHHKLSR